MRSRSTALASPTTAIRDACGGKFEPATTPTIAPPAPAANKSSVACGDSATMRRAGVASSTRTPASSTALTAPTLARTHAAPIRHASAAGTVLAALACLMGAACVRASVGAVSAVDDAGVRVELATPARRIVALSPHATELLFAAGAGGAIVGVVAGSNFPPQASRIAVVGDANAVDLERIVALAPDLVVTWPYTTAAQLAAIRQRGIRVFTSDPKTIDGIAQDIERLGVLVGAHDAAARSAAAFRADIESARRHAPARQHPPLRVFYEIWGQPIYTIGGHHLISEAITLCGGQNVFAALGVAAPIVSEEAVIAARRVRRTRSARH